MPESFTEAIKRIHTAILNDPELMNVFADMEIVIKNETGEIPEINIFSKTEYYSVTLWNQNYADSTGPDDYIWEFWNCMSGEIFPYENSLTGPILHLPTATEAEVISFIKKANKLILGE